MNSANVVEETIDMYYDIELCTYHVLFMELD